MKTFAFTNHWQMNEVPQGIPGGELLHLDGQCFVGENGVLGVALSSYSLNYLQGSSSPTHWLVPVENIAVVKAAAELPGEVLWLCSQPPSRLLGHLMEDFRGAWLDGNVIVIQLEGSQCRITLQQPPHPSVALAHLARAVAQVWKEQQVSPSPSQPINIHQPSQLIAL